MKYQKFFKWEINLVYSSSFISVFMIDHLPLETEGNETRVKFSRYPLCSIFPSEWNIISTLSPVTRRFWPVLLPQYIPSIVPIPSVILKKSLLQRKVKIKFQLKNTYSLSITIVLSHKQLIHAVLACIINLWCTQGGEEHEGRVRVARVAKQSCSSFLSVLQLKWLLENGK